MWNSTSLINIGAIFSEEFYNKIVVKKYSFGPFWMAVGGIPRRHGNRLQQITARWVIAPFTLCSRHPLPPSLSLFSICREGDFVQPWKEWRERTAELTKKKKNNNFNLGNLSLILRGWHKREPIACSLAILILTFSMHQN